MTEQTPRSSNGYTEQLTEYQQTKLTIKKQLYTYKDLLAECIHIRERLKRLELLMYSPSSSNFSGMPRGSNASSPVESLADKHMTLERRYRKQLEKLAVAQTEVEDMIEGLELTERTLTRYRYLDGLAWEKICDKMNYSWRQVHRIHNKMLDKLTAAEIERSKGTE